MNPSYPMVTCLNDGLTLEVERLTPVNAQYPLPKDYTAVLALKSNGGLNLLETSMLRRTEVIHHAIALLSTLHGHHSLRVVWSGLKDPGHRIGVHLTRDDKIELGLSVGDSQSVSTEYAQLNPQEAVHLALRLLQRTLDLAQQSPTSPTPPILDASFA